MIDSELLSEFKALYVHWDNFICSEDLWIEARDFIYLIDSWDNNVRILSTFTTFLYLR